MLRFLLVMLRGFFGRCPLCGKGKIFRGYFAMNQKCSNCGVEFEATGNQSTGAMGINISLTILLGFIGGVFLVIYFADQLMLGLGILILVMALFHIVFYRFARGLWLGLMTMTGDLEHGKDDRG